MGLLLGERDLREGDFWRLPFKGHFNLCFTAFISSDAANFSDISLALEWVTWLALIVSMALSKLMSHFPGSSSRTRSSFTPRIRRLRTQDSHSVPKPGLRELHQWSYVTIKWFIQQLFTLKENIPFMSLVSHRYTTFGVPGWSSNSSILSLPITFNSETTRTSCDLLNTSC